MEDHTLLEQEIVNNVNYYTTVEIVLKVYEAPKLEEIGQWSAVTLAGSIGFNRYEKDY